MNLGYMNMNVKAVALGSGVAMAYLGNSHYGIEDAAIMRSIPTQPLCHRRTVRKLSKRFSRLRNSKAQCISV